MKNLVSAIKQVSSDPKAYPLYYIMDLLVQAGHIVEENKESADRINKHLDAIEKAYQNLIDLLTSSMDRQLRDVCTVSLDTIKELMDEFVMLDLPYGSRAYAKANTTKHMLEDLLKK